MPNYQRALLIVNPVAGHARGLRLSQQLKDALEARGLVCSVRVTNGQGDARRWSAAAGADTFDLIVAIGGDGTVGEVVAGQARSTVKVPIAIVPVGTANVVALALALPWLPGMAVTTVFRPAAARPGLTTSMPFLSFTTAVPSSISRRFLPL